MTHDMIEKIIGQRTRVAQQSRRVACGRDRQVRDHLHNRAMDRSEAMLIAMPPC